MRRLLILTVGLLALLAVIRFAGERLAHSLIDDALVTARDGHHQEAMEKLELAEVWLDWTEATDRLENSRREVHRLAEEHRDLEFIERHLPPDERMRQRMERMKREYSARTESFHRDRIEADRRRQEEFDERYGQNPPSLPEIRVPESPDTSTILQTVETLEEPR